MDYVAYLETAWAYFPYLLYTFVLLTFLPKSLGRIKAFADADYEANRHKFHRCYAPGPCCHALGEAGQPKPKPRKAVTRVYPKRQASADQEATPVPPRRPHAPAVLAQNHVNEIARMFESGGTSSASAHSRKVNRVLPEIRMNSLDIDDLDETIGYNNNNSSHYNNRSKRSSMQQELLLENIENSANLLNRSHTAEAEDLDLDTSWRSEPIVIPRSSSAQQQQPVLQRRQRDPPSTLAFSDGNSATPSSSSASPSLSPAPTLDFSPTTTTTPTLRRLPLNMKSSLEDIFAAIARNAESNEGGLKFAGCHALSPVTSIEDILSQRRLSRPLSAYSISDLLNEEGNNQVMDEAFVESFLRSLNKT